MVNSLSCCCLMSKILNHSRRFRVLSRTGVTTVNTRSVMASCNGLAGSDMLASWRLFPTSLIAFTNRVVAAIAGLAHCQAPSANSTKRQTPQ